MSESAAAASSDPLKAVAEAMDAAVKATKEGVDEIRANAASGEFLSRLAYKTCYAISYGVVFPTVFAARAIPKDNAAVHGFIDGAHAAIDMVGEMKSRSVSDESQAMSGLDHPSEGAGG
jgi:hypothetical protein